MSEAERLKDIRQMLGSADVSPGVDKVKSCLCPQGQEMTLLGINVFYQLA